MKTMYPGIPFSPQATLTDSIGEADTIIKVSDVSMFPGAPNYATIGTDEKGETILYTAKTADSLSGCQRGVEGTPKTWRAGEVIARNFTAADYNAMIENIKATAESAEANGSKLPFSFEITMVSLGFAAKSTVSVGDFLKALRAKIGLNAFVHVRWYNEGVATVSDGSISVEVNGGLFLVSGQGDINNRDWSSYVCIYVPLNSPVIYRFSARTTDRIGILNSVSMKLFSPGVGDFLANGSVPMTGNLQMGGNRITELGQPVEETDAARLKDVERKVNQAKSTRMTLSLPAAGWIDNAQTVQNTSLVAEGYNYIVSPEPASLMAYAASFVYADDVTTDGQITFHATQVPETDLTVIITRMEVA